MAENASRILIGRARRSTTAANVPNDDDAACSNMIQKPTAEQLPAHGISIQSQIAMIRCVDLVLVACPVLGLTNGSRDEEVDGPAQELGLGAAHSLEAQLALPV